MSNDVKEQTAQERLAEVELKIKEAQLERELKMLKKADLENQELDFKLQQLTARKETNESELRVRAVGLESSNAEERVAYTVCNHLKGGSMRNYPKGDGRDGYSIFRHRLSSGDMFIRCLRCGKEWLPPVKPVADSPDFKDSRGKFDEGKYRRAAQLYKMKMEDYKTALSFTTDNTDSGGPRFQFRDREKARAAFRGTNPPENPAKEAAKLASLEDELQGI
jgi:hypothetical protein